MKLILLVTDWNPAEILLHVLYVEILEFLIFQPFFNNNFQVPESPFQRKKFWNPPGIL